MNYPLILALIVDHFPVSSYMYRDLRLNKVSVIMAATTQLSVGTMTVL